VTPASQGLGLAHLLSSTELILVNDILSTGCTHQALVRVISEHAFIIIIVLGLTECVVITICGGHHPFAFLLKCLHLVVVD
jgi:hypothetical protein